MDLAKHGAAAAASAAALSLASVALGVALMVSTGVGGAMVEAGGNAKLAAAPALLTAAELVKVASAVATAIAVSALNRISAEGRPARFAAAVGYTGAFVFAVSAGLALVSLYGRVGDAMTTAKTVHLMGLVALALSGMWAALASGPAPAFPRWLRVAAWLYAVAAIGTLIAPAAGLAALIFSLIWFIGLAFRLRGNRAR